MVLRWRKKRVLFIIAVCSIAWICLRFQSLYCSERKGMEILRVLCSEYQKNRTSGNMCEIICKDDIHLTCNGFHGGKSVVLKAKTGSNIFIIKSSSSSLHDVEAWNPDFDQYDLLATLEAKLRIDFPDSSTERIFDYFHAYDLTSPVIRNDLWNLANDHEFVLSLMLETLELFPRILGHCGTLFAVEYVDTLNNFKYNNSSIVIAKKIAEFLIHVRDDTEKLYLCDVKPSHFGESVNGIWKYVDLDAVLSYDILARNIKLRSSCTTDLDCSYFDCVFLCNKNTKQCGKSMVTSNVQIICKNIFIGGFWLGRGLLEMHKSTLIRDTLLQCINDSAFTEEDLINALSAIEG
ncbi:divergent protein kinase domain 1C-like [Artemia franciscana]|uniref:FAM69 protein-kinase domain-containing protein n=1 Tax=Artemia franciscana TaxID=6661 RepID=A0AA88HK75_ARTSF|nr:hypothetical protein QYM36_014240 [Artemia franciscana]